MKCFENRIYVSALTNLYLLSDYGRKKPILVRENSSTHVELVKTKETK